jgi:hypothetical protein
MSREGSHRARAAVGLGLVFLPLVVALLATVSRASIVLVGLLPSIYVAATKTARSGSP